MMYGIINWYDEVHSPWVETQPLIVTATRLPTLRCLKMWPNNITLTHELCSNPGILQRKEDFVQVLGNPTQNLINKMMRRMCEKETDLIYQLDLSILQDGLEWRCHWTKGTLPFHTCSPSIYWVPKSLSFVHILLNHYSFIYILLNHPWICEDQRSHLSAV